MGYDIPDNLNSDVERLQKEKNTEFPPWIADDILYRPASGKFGVKVSKFWQYCWEEYFMKVTRAAATSGTSREIFIASPSLSPSSSPSVSPPASLSPLVSSSPFPSISPSASMSPSPTDLAGMYKVLDDVKIEYLYRDEISGGLYPVPNAMLTIRNSLEQPREVEEKLTMDREQFSSIIDSERVFTF